MRVFIPSPDFPSSSTQSTPFTLKHGSRVGLGGVSPHRRMTVDSPQTATPGSSTSLRASPRISRGYFFAISPQSGLLAFGALSITLEGESIAKAITPPARIAPETIKPIAMRDFRESEITSGHAPSRQLSSPRTDNPTRWRGSTARMRRYRYTPEAQVERQEAPLTSMRHSITHQQFQPSRQPFPTTLPHPFQGEPKRATSQTPHDQPPHHSSHGNAPKISRSLTLGSAYGSVHVRHRKWPVRWLRY